jgi:haloalkane dehalogenase
MAVVKKRIRVFDREMAFVEAGEGDPIVFLHGNPTSSYLWRGILPQLAGQARCLAPDLMGMGDSDPLPANTEYRFTEHYRYLEGALDRLGITDGVTLVLHDWGSALGFHWAASHPERVRGIAYMEAIVRPLTWNEWPEASRGLFQALRSAKGEELILQRNLFIEKILPGSVLRELNPEEMDEYRRPFSSGAESRRPMLAWPRELPIDGTPADVVGIVTAYASFMAASAAPKLFINADPGAILTGPAREYCRSWPNQTEVTVRGSHFVQEDSPQEISAALSDWYATLTS